MSEPHQQDEPVVVPIEREIDLHPFSPKDVLSVVDEYLREAGKRGFREVRLVHGRGKGVQRAQVQRMLRNHPLVGDYYDDPRAHLGATVVVLSVPVTDAP